MENRQLQLILLEASETNSVCADPQKKGMTSVVDECESSQA